MPRELHARPRSNLLVDGMSAPEHSGGGLSAGSAWVGTTADGDLHPLVSKVVSEIRSLFDGNGASAADVTVRSGTCHRRQVAIALDSAVGWATEVAGTPGARDPGTSTRMGGRAAAVAEARARCDAVIGDPATWEGLARYLEGGRTSSSGVSSRGSGGRRSPGVGISSRLAPPAVVRDAGAAASAARNGRRARPAADRRKAGAVPAPAPARSTATSGTASATPRCSRSPARHAAGPARVRTGAAGLTATAARSGARPAPERATSSAGRAAPRVG